MKTPESQFNSIKPPEEAVQQAPKEIRTKEEADALKDKLRFITKVLTDNFGIKIIPGDGWAAGLSEKFEEERRKNPGKSWDEFDKDLLKPEIITYPENELMERSEDFIFGVLRHEIGHVKHSDYKSIIEMGEKAKEEKYNPMDAHFIYNAWEDGRVNRLEAGTSKAAKHRIGTYLNERFKERLLDDFEKKSLPLQYGLLCLGKGVEPFLDDADTLEKLKSKVQDENVIDAYRETEPILDEFVNEPDGRKSFVDIIWPKAWPVYKKLIDKYIEVEAERQYGILMKLEIEKPQENKEESQNEEGSAKEDSAKEDDSRGQNQPQEPAENREEAKPPEPQKLWEELPEEKKEKYREKAREKLTKEEQEVVKILQPKSMQMEQKPDGTMEIKIRIASDENIKKAKEEEHRIKQINEEKNAVQKRTQKESRENLEEAQERLKERETGLTKNEREHYDQYYNPVKKYINILVDRLDEVFPPKKEAGWEGDYQKGKRIIPRKLASEIPIGRGKFFSKKEALEEIEAAFLLLVDTSGSMRDGGKIENALKAAIMMAEALSKKNIPVEIQAFHSKHLTIKGFDEQYRGKKKMDMMRLIDEVYGRDSGSTYIASALDAASRKLQKELLRLGGASGALIVFTDGQPSDEENYELGKVFYDWSKKIPILGVGIGKEMKETMNRYFGKNALVVEDIKKLPRELLKILEKQISKFESKTE